ncbi:MAG: hypothetical protein COV29_01730 [Candidatus Yanofskybacteria bacterium CG10_big_fil_rev_8_21_14_0_10_36_16]|uniref:SIS domain-containing protein n=1 Tax=Candidatus Yanofskybacteria bacterium CG10_big_fil_rev_8_21_14_0_10_36_16 TaxID=1975096 RepID=A0A2J0Q7D2_9BACT|nr:MAG: hypothetical protein COV29_01730 [Candidatus Yanofskybacteria bacterium CG10_big_fil_rev_8_21_14_0_10_36_16]
MSKDMLSSIKEFSFQFEYEPKIENEENFQKKDRFIIAGMGGSNLGTDFLKMYKPDLDLHVHRNYGLPSLPSFDSLSEHTLIASSYSGGTEELIDAYTKAKESGMSLIAVTGGGKLLELAKNDKTPYIELPNTGIEPRVALGFSLRAMLKVMGDEDALLESGKLKDELQVEDYEKTGKELSEKTKGRVPVIYSSTKNKPLSRVWKINLNESGKIPSFWNVFPELNHNEMTGFDSIDEMKDRFNFIFLSDSSDHPRIQKRMEVAKKLFEDRNMPVEVIKLESNKGIFYKIFSTVVLAGWHAYYTAESYGLSASEVPMVEDFKKMIKD